MKPQWNILNEAIDKHADIIQVFVDNVTDPATVKNLKHIMSSCNKVLALRDEFGKLIESVSPVDLSIPFEGEIFLEKWKYYKEYLEEEYQIYFYSRREQIMLNQLKKWSGNNVEQAIAILEFFITNGYVKFFKPSEKQLSGEELPASEDQTILKNTSLNVDKSKRV